MRNSIEPSNLTWLFHFSILLLGFSSFAVLGVFVFTQGSATTESAFPPRISSGARFGFILDEKLKEASACDEVKAALSAKISREQIGAEDEQRRLSIYAAMFLPLGRQCIEIGKQKIDSLKQSVSNAETVINLHNALEKFLSLLPHFVQNGDVKLAEVDMGREYVDLPLTSKESNLRVLTGFILRKIKDFWRVALLMSTLLYPTDLNKNLKPEDCRALFVEAERSINNLGLDKVWDVKPLLNGKEIIDALQLKSGGPLVSKWQRKLLAWQLAHPLGSAEECLKWLKETHSSSTRSAGDMEELNGPNNKKSKTEDCD